MQSLAIFLVVAVVHFVLGVAGVVVALPAAFDTQAGFWAAPGKATLAWSAAVLLAPLAWLRKILPEATQFGYLEIALVSILFGAAAVGVARLRRIVRDPPSV